MDPSQDFKSLQEKIQAALVATTRTTNQLAAEDLSFQKTSDPAIEEQLDDTNGHLLSLASSLIKSATKGTDLRAAELEDADDIDVHWSRIVDVFDTLLEKADTCLDEYTGLIKRKTAPTEESGPLPKRSKPQALDQSFRRANILKPQDKFDIKPDNLDPSPWKPILTKKPHATIPLEKSLETFTNDENQTIQYDYSALLPHSLLTGPMERQVSSITPEEKAKNAKSLRQKRNRKLRDLAHLGSVGGANGIFRYKHPYETEILNLQYPEHVFKVKEPIKYLPVETTVATYVDTYEGVLEMLEELKGATEIAIDTEHHDFRTYSGLLSLMQISTREKDWIIDTLQPWRHKLEVINEVFADPKIVKVLQGAYMDILWLQRDCGLYIVGLFDTYEAAISLGYPGRGLAYLLKRFVDFDADKKYQLADWRIRPIPDEMYYYARSDTHYLLYIYDMIRNELLEKSNRSIPEQDLIHHVLDRSKETSLRRHEKVAYDAEGGQGLCGWYNLLIRNSSGTFSKEQFAVFRAVHKWRDDLARRQDESPLYIMSNSTLFDIARRLPPDPKALHSTFSHNTSFAAKRAITDLFKVITKARAESADGPSVVDVLRRNGTTNQIAVGTVAQTAFPQLKGNESESLLDTQELVSEKSRLWGKVALSSRWEEGSAGTNNTGQPQRFALPWAHALGNATVSAEQLADTTEVNASEKPEPPPQEQARETKEPDTQFTLKAGVKRKAAQSESESEEEEEDEDGDEEEEEEDDAPAASNAAAPTVPAEEEMSLIDSDAERAAAKAAKKKAKKERKAQRQAEAQEKKAARGAQREARREAKAAKKAEKKAQRTAEQKAARKLKKQQEKGREEEGDEDEEDEDGGEDSEDEQPFDYTQAQSVLNAKRSGGGAAAAGTNHAAAPKFNPYANAMMADGPKPARRMHGEKTGKSATFKK